MAATGDPGLPTNGVQAALVEIDRATGIVRVLEILGGRGLWPGDQSAPGRRADPRRRRSRYRARRSSKPAAMTAPVNPSAVRWPTICCRLASVIPDIAVAHVETPYGGSTLGAKGAGEAGTCAAPAAILNAVNDARRRSRQHCGTADQPVDVLRAIGDLPELAHEAGALRLVAPGRTGRRARAAGRRRCGRAGRRTEPRTDAQPAHGPATSAGRHQCHPPTWRRSGARTVG